LQARFLLPLAVKLSCKLIETSLIFGAAGAPFMKDLASLLALDVSAQLGHPKNVFMALRFGIYLYIVFFLPNLYKPSGSES
jgi:hypothetical protein